MNCDVVDASQGLNDATATTSAVSLTDALPAEMVCKIVSFFRAYPAQWMALLLTSRSLADAARATLDPASDRVRSAQSDARAPTLAARLVTQYADAVPRVLDAYRCANASALLVEACRAGDIGLMRTLIAGRDQWRVDVAYRHNRALLECVRLHSAIGVQLLLATGEADPTDHPGAAHVGRCMLHDDPACRRDDHPEPCDACARGQHCGPWSDSDTEDEPDGEEPYFDLVDNSDPLADTDEDDEGDAPSHNPHGSNGHRFRAADHHSHHSVDHRQHSDRHHGDVDGDDDGAHKGTADDRRALLFPLPHAAPAGADGGPTMLLTEDGEEEDDTFGVDYDALFERDADDDGAGVYGTGFEHAYVRTLQRDAWSLDDNGLRDDDVQEQYGGGGEEGDDDDDDGDYVHDPRNHRNDQRHKRADVRADKAVDGDGNGAKQVVDCIKTASDDARPPCSIRLQTARAHDGPHTTENADDPHAAIYASIARDGYFTDDDGGDLVTHAAHEAIDTTHNVYTQSSDDCHGDQSRRQSHADDRRSAPTSVSASLNTEGSTQGDAPPPESSGHALAIRRAHLAQCVCRRGMTFAIVWIDADGREIGGRADARQADPLWFLVCEDPSALVADGPLSFLMNSGRARDLTPARGAAFVAPEDDHNDGNDDRVTGMEQALATDALSAMTMGSHNADPIYHMGAEGRQPRLSGVTADDGTDHTINTNNNDGDDAITFDDTASMRLNPVDGIGAARDSGDAISGTDSSENVQNNNDTEQAVGLVVRRNSNGDRLYRTPAVCACASNGRAAYTRSMERWCPLFWAALMSVGVLGQLLGHMAAEPNGARRWACRFQDVLAMAAAQIIVFSSASRMEALSDVHAAALDLALTSGGIDLAVHGDFLVAFAADRGCSDVVEMLVEYEDVDAGAHNDLALRRALWRYVRLYRPIQGAGAHLEPEERLNRMALYGATLIALAIAIGIDTGGMEPADAHMEPIDEAFVRTLARRVYPGLTPNDIGRLRLPPLRPHYPPPFTRP